MESVRKLIDAAYDTGYNAAFPNTSNNEPFIARRNALRLELETNLESVRLIIRNAQSELPKKHWLQKDLLAVERWLQGQADSIN